MSDDLVQHIMDGYDHKRPFPFPTVAWEGMFVEPKYVIRDDELRSLVSEIKRLRAALRWQEDRDAKGNGSTHAGDCHIWGPRHYECALAKIEALEAENARLREALHRISLSSQNSGTTRDFMGKEARAALEGT